MAHGFTHYPWPQAMSLTEHQRRVLSALSGRPHNIQTLARLLESTPARVRAAMQRLMRKGVEIVAVGRPRMYCTAEAFESLLRERPNLAADIYNLMLEQGEDDLMVWLRWAMVQSNLGRFPEAIKAYAQVVRLAPQCASARYNLALLCLKTGRVSEAEQQIAELRNLDPEQAARLDRWLNR